VSLSKGAFHSICAILILDHRPGISLDANDVVVNADGLRYLTDIHAGLFDHRNVGLIPRAVTVREAI
jgi:hypothetical protein